MRSIPPRPESGRRDLVLDTNVVLDVFLFRDPAVAPLERALTSGRFRWLSTREMRDEFEHVIRRDRLAHRVFDAGALLAAFDACATDHPPPPMPGESEHLRCADPDDQKFIDLAIVARVEALLTHDRAVLRLAARARRFDVVIATPQDWLRGSG